MRSAPDRLPSSNSIEKPGPRFPGSWKWWAIAILVASSAFAYHYRASFLKSAASFLVVREPLQRADVIFLLNGDPNTRPFHAFALYQQRLAPLILIARAENSPTVSLGLIPNTTELNKSVLYKLGLPASDLVELRIPGGVTSTFDEANVLRSYATLKDIHRVLVVTSSMHTRRARWALDRVLRGTNIRIIMAPVSDRKYDETNWWRSEDGWIGFQNEYLKLVFYLVRYGL